MSNSSASGHRSAFSQTFNLLSQYVKEKKPIGDLSLGMFGNRDERGRQNDAFRPTTMNLFPVNDESAGEEEPILSNAKPMELFPQHHSCFAASQSSEPRSSQMTIFYAGQVIVVNDFPAHKAKEIMEFAGQGVGVVSRKSKKAAPAVENAKERAAVENTDQQIKERAKQQPTTTTTTTTTPVVADLPIARKASLHRFLEKRKDRIKAKAPYSTTSKKGGGDVPLKADDQSNSWLGLAATAPRS